MWLDSGLSVFDVFSDPFCWPFFDVFSRRIFRCIVCPQPEIHRLISKYVEEMVIDFARGFVDVFYRMRPKHIGPRTEVSKHSIETQTSTLIYHSHRPIVNHWHFHCLSFIIIISLDTGTFIKLAVIANVSEKCHATRYHRNIICKIKAGLGLT